MRAFNDTAKALLDEDVEIESIGDESVIQSIDDNKMIPEENPPIIHQNTSDQVNFDCGSFIATVVEEAYNRDIVLYTTILNLHFLDTRKSDKSQSA